jgi:hypothetical protein
MNAPPLTDAVLSTLTNGAKSKTEICSALCTDDAKPDIKTVNKALMYLRQSGQVETTGQRRGMRYLLPTTTEGDTENV